MQNIIKLFILFTLTFSTNALAENFGIVDLQRVFINYNETEKARKDFEGKQKELREEIEKKQKKVEKAQEDNKKPEDIQKLITEIQEELQPKQEELVRLNNELMAKIRADIIRSTKKVAKDYGIDIVVDKQAILTGGFDLTEFVIEDLNN